MQSILKEGYLLWELFVNMEGGRFAMKNVKLISLLRYSGNGKKADCDMTKVQGVILDSEVSIMPSFGCHL